MPLELDIDHVLHFLDMLDRDGRHTIASEAPFGSKDGGPLWERGQTHEAHWREKGSSKTFVTGKRAAPTFTIR